MSKDDEDEDDKEEAQARLISLQRLTCSCSDSILNHSLSIPATGVMELGLFTRNETEQVKLRTAFAETLLLLLLLLFMLLFLLPLLLFALIPPPVFISDFIKMEVISFIPIVI